MLSTAKQTIVHWLLFYLKKNYPEVGHKFLYGKLRKIKFDFLALLFLMSLIQKNLHIKIAENFKIRQLYSKIGL